MKGKSGDFASLYTSDQLQYLGVREVNQYVVYSYKMFSRPQSNQVEIVIKVDQNLIDNNKYLFLTQDGAELVDHHPDHLCSNCPTQHDQLLHQLLQGLLLRSHRHRQPDGHACPHHAVHQRLKQPASHLLPEDDRCLSHLLPPHPLCGGFTAHSDGQHETVSRQLLV